MMERWRMTALCAALIGSAASATAVTHTRPQAPPRVAWEPTGPPTMWRGISFIVPAGMRGVDKRDFYDMAGPGINGRIGQCSILILGDERAGPDLAKQAQDLLVSAMASLGQRVVNARAESDLTADRRVGRSSDGWDWVELSGTLGEGVGGRARIMLIVRGATVVPIMAVAVSGNGCVGLPSEPTAGSNTITWAALYHSLRLAGSTPSAHLREQIIGGWAAMSVSTGGQVGTSQGETYAPNGRYARASMVGAYGAGSEFLARGFTGDGRYVVEGNRLSIFPDRGPSQTTLVRIVEDRVATTPPRTTVQLCKINVDAGGPWERCLPRSGQ
jgi:hypothetical protein